MKNKNAKAVTIRAKMTIIIALFTAVMLTVIWLLFVVFLDDFYREAKYRELLSSARIIETHITADTSVLSDTIAELCRRTDENVLILRTTGSSTESISYVQPRDILSNSFAVAAIIESTRRDGGESSYTFDGSKNDFEMRGGAENDSMLFAKIIENGESSYVILINVQLTPVDATTTTIMSLLLILSVVFIVTAVIVGYIIAKTLSVPLTKLTATAKHIGTPEYKKLEGNPGCLETAELNETLSMASTELQKVEDLRREIISNVSHDLRTPLTMISGYGEMMRDIPGENNAENIQIIIDEAEHLNRLVNDLLSLSKLESGMDQLELREFNVTESLLALVGRYSTMRAVEGYALDFEYEKEYVITGDELKLIQVFYNLINNAINYTGESKRVLIKQAETTEDNKKYLRFDIIDDGDGILPENLPYIWDRYYKENRAHKRAGVGTGLGLSIVKKIIEQHGGKYGVISEPGKGSDFYIMLSL